MKTKDKIRTITFYDFKQDPHLIDYVDENIIILDNADATLASPAPVKIDCFVIVLCFEGKSKLNLNNKEYIFKANQYAFLLPGSIIRHHTLESTSIKVRIVAFSSQFVQHVTKMKEETWNIGFYLYRNPILAISRNNSYKLYLYKELARISIEDKQHAYSKETMRHLLAAIFCELLATLHQNIPFYDNASINPYDRSLHIFRKFMEKVSEDDGSHRSVSYYANLLCYTPKHISTVIKKISGKAPLTIINEHAINCIKHDLLHSDMSMKELADKFAFSNPSFFGKFVKQHLGNSPQQFRNNQRINNFLSE